MADKPGIYGRPVGWMDNRGWLISDTCKVKYFKHYSQLQNGYDEPVYTAKQLGGTPEKTGAQMEAELLAEDNPEPAHRAELRKTEIGRELLAGTRGEVTDQEAEKLFAKREASAAHELKTFTQGLRDRRMLQTVLRELETTTHFCENCDHDMQFHDWDIVRELKEYLK